MPDPTERAARAPVAFLVVALGVLGGLGVFTFGYAEGHSYLYDDPTVCVNCHVMDPMYDSWQNGGHRHVAVCNDCHLPPNKVGKWVTKADNGFFHTLAFTLGNFHEPIQIKPRNRRVTQEAARVLGESIDFSRRAQAMVLQLRAGPAPAGERRPAEVHGVTPTDRAPPGPYERRPENENTIPGP